MIQHVWEAARRSTELDRVLIACEDEEIRDLAKGFGVEAVLTPQGITTGTDRVAFVAEGLSEAQWVVNIQGDEPMLDPRAVDQLVRSLKTFDCDMATLAFRRQDEAGLSDVNVVKVLVSSSGRAMYFSRHPLRSDLGGKFLKHIGVYGFRRDALLKFCELPPSPLEQLERLEQLRALEAGFHIQVVEVSRDVISVDTPEELSHVEREWRESEMDVLGDRT